MRSIVDEVMVGQTQYSYAYAQPPRKDTPYNLAHGTLAAEALTPTITRVSYTMLRDDSVLPDDAARERFIGVRRNLVGLAEFAGNFVVAARGTEHVRPAVFGFDAMVGGREVPLLLLKWVNQ